MAKKKWTSEFSVSDILGLYTLRRDDGDEGRVRDIAISMRELCRLDRKVQIPSQYKATTREVRTPFVRDAWHRVTSSLVAKMPVIHTLPLDEKRKDYRDAASIAERFDLALLDRLNKELGQDIIYNLSAQLVRDGESVLKIVHRPDAWANFPGGVDTEEQDNYKKLADFPIAWRDIDRLCIVYENGEYGDDWVIEYGEYARPYIKYRYGMEEEDGKLVNPRAVLEGKPMPEGLQTSSTGRSVKVEFFNSREWHVIIDGCPAPGFPKANPYSPFLPYFRASAYEKESLLYSLMFLVPRLDELLTMKLNWSVLGAYPNPIIQSLPNVAGALGLEAVGIPAEADTKPFRWSSGKAIELPLGKTFSFVSPPPVGRDLNDMAILLKSLIDIAGIPSIMRGTALSGESGYLANQQLAAASMAYRIVAISAQRQLEKGLEFTHWLVQHVIRQPVYAFGWSEINGKTQKPTRKANTAWLSLSPDGDGPNQASLSKIGRVEVRYRPVLPTDDQARAMIALQLTNSSKPLFNRRHALETLLQEEDPDSILDAIYVEQAVEQEPLRSMIVAEALKEAGIILPSTIGAASELVGPTGERLLPPGPSNLNPVPRAEEDVLGTPAVTGLTQPVVPGRPGGRPAGAYPGLPPRR